MAENFEPPFLYLLLIKVLNLLFYVFKKCLILLLKDLNILFLQKICCIKRKPGRVKK